MLGKSGLADLVVVAGVAGYIAKVQLDLMAMPMQRLMIGKRVEVNPQPLHHQE